MSDLPGDGDSIWIAVMEWDGVNTHVEYAQTFIDVDGLIVQRYESKEYETWPPRDILFWMPCDVPPFIAAANHLPIPRIGVRKQ